MKPGIFQSLVIAGLLALSVPALAAEAEQPAATDSAPPERIIRPMQAVDPVTLRAEGVSIRLWGIKPAVTSETPLELKALDIMDSLTNGQMVNCKIVGGTIPELIGQCQNQGNEELAIALLENGYVVVDRRQTYNTVLATGYAKAQEAARLKGKGVWKFTQEAEGEAPPIPKWLKPHFNTLLPLALLFGPFAGLLLMAMVMFFGLRRIGLRQDGALEEARRKEDSLHGRETQVLVSTLQGELTDNRNKIDAFLAIYGDTLAALKNPAIPPKYQAAGDIVQKHPAFSKTVFEASVGKLSLLDVQTAGILSKLYALLPKEPEYVNLEPNVPLDTAVKLLEKVVREAQALLPAIDAALAALRVAVPAKD